VYRINRFKMTLSGLWNKENDHDTEWSSKESHTRNDDDHTIDSFDTHMDHIAFNTHYSTYNDISTSSTSTHKGYTSSSYSTDTDATLHDEISTTGNESERRVIAFKTLDTCWTAD
jgi:hypothetical protein